MIAAITQSSALLAQTKSHNLTCIPTERTFLAKVNDEETVNARMKLGYLKVANLALRDRRISIKALGILLELLSLPKKSWNYSIGGLASLKTDGRTAVSNGLVELEKTGYLKRTRAKADDGSFAELSWRIVDRPDVSEEIAKSDAFGQCCNEGYTLLPNAIFFDRRLSYREVGLLAILSSLPPTWRPSISGLVNLAGSGKTTIKGALHSLEAKGYLLRERHRDENGQLGATIIVIDQAAGMRVKSAEVDAVENAVENCGENIFFGPPEAENPAAENPEAENERNKVLKDKELFGSNDDPATDDQTVRWAEAHSGASSTCERNNAPLSSFENENLIPLETTAPSGLQALIAQMPDGKRLVGNISDSLVEAWNESVRAFEHEWLVYKIFEFSLKENSSHDHACSLSGLERWLRSTEAKDERDIGFHYVRLYTHGPWKGLKPYDVFSDPDSTIPETEEEAYSETLASLGLAQDPEPDTQGVYDDTTLLREWKSVNGPVETIEADTVPEPDEKPFVAVESKTDSRHTVVVSHRTWSSRLIEHFESMGLTVDGNPSGKPYVPPQERLTSPVHASIPVPSAKVPSEETVQSVPSSRAYVTESQILESVDYLGIDLGDGDTEADFEAYLARRRKERLAAEGGLR